MPSGLSLSQKLRFLLLMFSASILLTVLLTYPHVQEWRTAVPGGRFNDAPVETWSFWWFERSIFVLERSPANFDYIYYPEGVSHPVEVAVLFPKLVTLPLIGFLDLDPLFAYNLNLFAATSLTMLFMAWLCLELTGSRLGALIGGIAFAFCANRTMHVLAGHFNLSLTYLYPLLVLLLVFLWRKPTIPRGLFLGFVLALSATIGLMPLAFFVGPVVASMLLYFLLVDRQRFLSRPFLSNLVIGLTTAFFLLVPIFYPLFASASRGELGWYQSIGSVEFSADLLSFIVPTRRHPLTQLWPGLWKLSDQVYGFGVSRFEGTVYLGWAALGLALAAVASYWKRIPGIRYWTTVALTSALLALGPWLRVAGRIVSIGDRPVIMPYAALMLLPFLSWGRSPGRLGLTVAFAVAILASFGAAWLLSRISNKKTRSAAGVCLAALVSLDALIAFPWPMIESPEVSAFYNSLAADKRPVAVLDLPVEGYESAENYTYLQVYHGHAIVGGLRYRRPPVVEQKMVEFQALAESGDTAPLAEAGIGYIVLHKRYLDEDRLVWLARQLGEAIGPASYEDGSIIAFKLNDVAQVAPKPIPIE